MILRTKVIREELDLIETMPLEDYATEVVELRKENAMLSQALADKNQDGTLVTVFRSELEELMEICDCRICPASYVRGQCKSTGHCKEAMMRWLLHDWDGLKRIVEKGEE